MWKIEEAKIEKEMRHKPERGKTSKHRALPIWRREEKKRNKNIHKHINILIAQQ